MTSPSAAASSSRWLTALTLRYPSGREPALIAALRSWLSGPGISRITVGMARQGFDFQLTRYDGEGWRAIFYSAGRAHSQTAAVGSAWVREPWTAVQRAAWNSFRKRETRRRREGPHRHSAEDIRSVFRPHPAALSGE